MTDGMTDRCKPVYPPLFQSGGIIIKLCLSMVYVFVNRRGVGVWKFSRNILLSLSLVTENLILKFQQNVFFFNSG